MKNTVKEVGTTEYENSHGHKPRGWGNWIFLVWESEKCHGEVTVTGNYGEARRKALAIANVERAVKVTVGS
tara:strand:- start:316 stop:528 length:213 start_codon:yes stop_codon:yes gene_type:complete